MIGVERRLAAPRWLRFLVPWISLVGAALIVAVVLLVSGHNPLSTYKSIYTSALGSGVALSGTFIYTTPVLLTGLAAAVAYRFRVWNIGGEGQLYMGAAGAGAVAVALGGWPAPLLIIATIFGGALAGALWGVIPGLLRAYLRTNELLTTLMLNYIAGLFIYYLIFDSNSYWRDLVTPAAKVYPTGKYIPQKAWWPALQIGPLTVPMGLLLGVGLAIVLLLLIKNTRFGYKLRVMGNSPSAAKYAGIRGPRLVVGVFAVSGGIAGIAGASQIGDFTHVLDPKGLQAAQYGYTGIVVAALARYNPVSAVLAAFLIGVLTNAGFALQGPSFPLGLTGAMEGIILFSMLGGEVLVRYRVRFNRSSAPLSSEAFPEDLGAPSALVGAGDAE